MNDEISKLLQKLSRENMHAIWQHAKNHDLDKLPDEEKQLAKIMLEHEDEFFNKFEFADMLSDYKFDPDSEVNPFLHITLHAVVENQLKAKDPIEVYQFYNSMIKNKTSRHDTLHLIAGILAPLIFYSMKQMKEFDLNLYRSLLKKYKNKKADKISSGLEKDLDNIFSEMKA